jgi:hypothetical protein
VSGMVRRRERRFGSQPNAPCNLDNIERHAVSDDFMQKGSSAIKCSGLAPLGQA